MSLFFPFILSSKYPIFQKICNFWYLLLLHHYSCEVCFLVATFRPVYFNVQFIIHCFEGGTFKKTMLIGSLLLWDFLTGQNANGVVVPLIFHKIFEF